MGFATQCCRSKLILALTNPEEKCSMMLSMALYDWNFLDRPRAPNPGSYIQEILANCGQKGHPGTIQWIQSCMAGKSALR